MSIPADFMLYNRAGQLVALAIIKNQRGTTPDWAAQIRHTILTNSDVKPSYFLLITPEQVHLWARYDEDAQPADVTIETTVLLELYLRGGSLLAEELGYNTFQFLALSDLSDLVYADAQLQARLREAVWAQLQATGFFDAVKQGHIDYASAA